MAKTKVDGHAALGLKIIFVCENDEDNEVRCVSHQPWGWVMSRRVESEPSIPAALHT